MDLPRRDNVEDEPMLNILDRVSENINNALNVENPIMFYAQLLNFAFDTSSSGSKTIVYCTLFPLSKSDLDDLKRQYNTKFETTLEKKIIDNFFEGHLLLRVCKSDRDLVSVTHNVTDDVQKLASAVRPSDDTWTSAFLEIFAKRSFQQINLIRQEFEENENKLLIEHIKEILKLDAMEYKAILDYSENKHKYYADCLSRGLKKKNRKLVALVIHRCQNNLLDIKNQYEENNPQKKLRDLIKENASGDYEQHLYSLFGIE